MLQGPPVALPISPLSFTTTHLTAVPPASTHRYSLFSTVIAGTWAFLTFQVEQGRILDEAERGLFGLARLFAVQWIGCWKVSTRNRTRANVGRVSGQSDGPFEIESHLVPIRF